MANQTTRLGKGSSVTTWDKRASWRSYYGEIYLEWILKYIIIISFGSFGLYPIISPIPKLLQTSFSHISINSSSILTVSMAMESPWKDLSIDTSHVSRQSIMAEILGRSTGNHYGTVY